MLFRSFCRINDRADAACVLELSHSAKLDRRRLVAGNLRLKPDDAAAFDAEDVRQAGKLVGIAVNLARKPAQGFRCCYGAGDDCFFQWHPGIVALSSL